MDRIKAASDIIKKLNSFMSGKITDYDFIKEVCTYFDSIKHLRLTSSDLKFLKYISNISGVPHYYDLLFTRFKQDGSFKVFDLNTFSSIFYESSLYVDENIKIHKFQKQILDRFKEGDINRFFLSATTSFGKTFLIYEIIKQKKYKNIALIFPTIALLSENYERLILDKNYTYFKDFNIHTLSEVKDISDKNIYIFTPERYLSFIDKNNNVDLDFVFIDEIYKIDNEYLIDSINQENERDTAYRVALQNILMKCTDVLLVGPYIEFPDDDSNQSFNVFLARNNFNTLNYNKFEIVGKKVFFIKNGNFNIDENLSFTLKSSYKAPEKIAEIVSAIRGINENVILYTKGPTTAETKAKDLLGKNVYQLDPNLNKFISHLEATFYLRDEYNEQWVVINALKSKVAIHHGLVPKYIQKEIINFFNLGYLDVLISTTTITEGVNTSAKNLIVLSSYKGDKVLKTFDAKNITGRAGRFLYHYSGRVLIIDKRFQEILDGSDDEIKHKNYDATSIKNEIDYFITDEEYLSLEDIKEKERIIQEQNELGIPDEIMNMFRVISHSDKIEIFKRIKRLNIDELQKIKALIQLINSPIISINFDGLKSILYIIKPIVKNTKLKFLIDTETEVKKGKNAGSFYPIIVYMLSAYLKDGFIGSVKYNLTRRDSKLKPFTINKAISESSSFIFNTLKYQLVKYLGVFNIMYKYQQSSLLGKAIDEVSGIDKLLLKLEYNATSDKGRLASDYGVPSKVIEYYEANEDIEIKESFDSFEQEKFEGFEKIVNKNNDV
ncbi:helicase-related protein [Pectobacterium atrosepticum]|uniref:helicase-related protein n=1 Tax=Pectobacterium atrosepticum TaxID=29471 RepID=UPI00301A0F68